MPSVNNRTFNEKSTYRRMCVTINLPDGVSWNDATIARALEALANQLRYFIAGRETGAEGRHHWQGYIEFDKPKTGGTVLRGFRKAFPLPISVHLESARGTAEQNIAYCTKEDKSPYVHGEPGQGQGNRNDLNGLFQMVREGATDIELVDSNATQWAHHRKSLADFRLLIAPKRDWETQLIFLWGPTGTGKTMHAQEWSPETVWWTGSFLNGYSGTNPVILFDDFDWERMEWQLFLTMTDRYAMTINVKGGFKNFAPRTIVFTSNSDPKTWYATPKVRPATLEAIHRRMDEYGESRYLGTLIPKAQNIMQTFFLRAPKKTGSEPDGSSQVGPFGPVDHDLCPSNPPATDFPRLNASVGPLGLVVNREIVDLTQDEDSDDSVRETSPPNIRRQNATLEDYDSDSGHSAHSIKKRRINRFLEKKLQEAEGRGEESRDF